MILLTSKMFLEVQDETEMEDDDEDIEDDDRD